MPRLVASLAAALGVLALLGTPLAAQELPERVPIGDGHMTVGFELKTTTHGSGGGRTQAHTLMKYIRPVESAGWTEAERATVARWEQLSVRERTAFFFQTYKGGHQATNFEVNVERYPHLDRSVSWYEHMNIPHIEVRSRPFDSPREAMAAIERLKADVPETIAFHVHTRFPDTSVATRAEAVTDWMRRVSWSIWLRRADYSSQTDFVLKAMDNQPINPEELEKALRAFANESPRAEKDLIERRGLRVSRLQNPDGGPVADLSTAPAEALREKLGLSASEAEAVVAARTRHRFQSFEDLAAAGVDEATRTRIAERLSSPYQLSSLSAGDLAARADIAPELAARIVRHRDGLDVRSAAGLGEVLGEARAAEVLEANRGRSPYLLDIELRGLMRDTRRIRRYLELTSAAFGEGRFGPWSHGADSPLRNEDSRGAIKFRTFGWHGAGSWEPRELEWLSEEVEKNRGRFGITSRLSGEELSAAVRRLATADTEAGKKMLLPSAFNWLFLPLEYDPALPEGVQAEVEARKAEYLRKLVRLAERVHAGEFGRPGEPGYRPTAVATRVRRILHDFVNEAYSDGGKRAKLFEWYELSLTNPEQVEERTRRWRRETGRDRSREWSERLAARRAATTLAGPPAGEGFAPRRSGGGGPARSTFWDVAEVEGVFRASRDAAVMRGAERLLELPAGERTGLAEALGRTPEVTLQLEASNDVDARYDAARNEVRVTTGLLGAIEDRAAELPEAERRDFRRRALGLVLGHELAHSYGVKAEAVADAEGLRVLERARLAEGPLTEADLRRTLSAFREGRLPLFDRLRALVRYGTEGGRTEALARAARGEADPLQRYRRGDGTLEWSRLTRDRALREGAGLAHFGLALFLKELAVVARTGDRTRIEEFFDGLLTTDFFQNYGLFVLGARAGEVAYARTLERFIRPRFVSSILKTNMVLAAGIALPQLADGTFEGRAFAISLTSLGLSTAAVKAGVSSIRWVYDLRRATQAGALARLGLGASRFARLGGWFYTAAELAVILYVAEDVEERVHHWLDLRAARDSLRGAGEELVRAAADRGATPASVREAAERYHAAWIAYRDFLYAPLHQDEALFAARLERAARSAQKAAEERRAALERLERLPALRANVERRYGSLDAYAAHLVAEDEARIAGDVEGYTTSYAKARDEHLREVYDEGRREGGLLRGVEHLPWLLAGGQSGAASDPFGDRTDWFASRGRDGVRGALASALGRASTNRLQAYEDELEVLQAVREGLARRGRGDLGGSLAEVEGWVRRAHAMDDALVHGEDGGFLSTVTTTPGMIEALERGGGR